jgi:hypothetical protein
MGCLVIIDQLDSVVSNPVAGLLENLAVDCKPGQDNVRVVVVTRNKEDKENKLVARLIRHGYGELISEPLSEDTAKTVLDGLGIQGYSADALQLARNLLNLQLIARIYQQQPAFDFTKLTSELLLWEEYLALLMGDKEPQLGEQIAAEAVRLAKLALISPDGLFELEFPYSEPRRRLVSWGIINVFEGRMHRFFHDSFQEFIYAWDATQRLAMPNQVLSELGPFTTQNVFAWMHQIYRRRNSSRLPLFLREVFGVNK